MSPKRENVGVFEKELPLLGEEEAEPGQVDLLRIRFDVREIGVVGQVERHTLAKHGSFASTPAFALSAGRALAAPQVHGGERLDRSAAPPLMSVSPVNDPASET